MARFSSFLRSLFGISKSTSIARSVQSQLFAGDRIFVRTKRKEVLSAPLQKNNKTDLALTSIAHNDIIGQLPGTPIRAKNDGLFRISHPSLEQYVALTPRKVTPIYAHDANLIVSLLDFNVPLHGTTKNDTPEIEILEAGTGHGSLTLHLARAIHAANPPPLALPPPPQRRLEKDGTVASISQDESWSSYLRKRNAVIHTIDVSPSFSLHAEKTIRGFRRGMYAPHVNFYVSHISDWITEQIEHRQGTRSPTVEPFISHVLLDLPSAHLELQRVSQILRLDGLLTVFAPSVTQIGDCVKEIKERSIPLQMEKTLELGMGISNGRVWDVRLAGVRSRSTDRGDSSILRSRIGNVGSTTASADEQTIIESQSEREAEQPDISSTECSTIQSDSISAEEQKPQPSQRPPETEGANQEVMVCRPKVGERIVGGGFVALFRKI
ncbi:putative trna (adenine-n)-methyltransferase [Phaeomoniella chlamydospora]|uniref:tRNA (adenine(58)-N(1))-methyltransferase catalytic subunit TRM61 n=1 Tax=Phaeomoniella chlamydospora TaxID=158046 RepID=A0A0G2EQD6_PHACM|nr:putative trna (adenine-n)-methyltransferase [Phaeomoniella chlamydospora]